MQPVKGAVFITTMGYIAVAISVVSAAVSMASAYTQAENAKEAAEYNAEVENKKAKDAANIGANEAADTRARARKIMSAQAEAGAMAGLDTSYGTPMGLLAETAGIGEKEALTQMNNAQRQAWGHKAQSELDRYTAGNAMTVGALNMTSSFLNGASSTYSTGMKAGLWKPQP